MKIPGFTLLLGVAHFSVITAHHRGMRKQQSFKRFEGKRANDSIIAARDVTSAIDCADLCSAHYPQCLSFNYKAIPDKPDLCELTSSQGLDIEALLNDFLFAFYRENTAVESKSCLDYLKRGAADNGVYNIHVEGVTHLVPVFCDFTSEQAWAWTLILSYELRERILAAFKTSFSENVPSNEKTPNMKNHRLSKRAMMSIQKYSTHWRATTNYNLDTGRLKPECATANGIPTDSCSISDRSFRDYMRGKNSDFDILSFEGGNVCKKVEYINIRGIERKNQEAPFWQTSAEFFVHTDSSRPSCGYNASAGSVEDEDNFGLYSATNPNFAGSANEGSTTQWWFGANLYS
ncbi:uncharacterized protein LOC116614430 [Nematostella vectensis]|uniref:uncharacterized protein LOC116614430 n=1 Tax=Nematostella vectensis TaxID=45351 RepID=UPI0020773663|nr:uncharacterized protein LOC116614430 [Nematostella vectensis]